MDIVTISIIMISAILMNFAQSVLFLTLIVLLIRYGRKEAQLEESKI